jgi:hypothetical protein
VDILDAIPFVNNRSRAAIAISPVLPCLSEKKMLFWGIAAIAQLDRASDYGSEG